MVPAGHIASFGYKYLFKLDSPSEAYRALPGLSLTVHTPIVLIPALSYARLVGF